MKLTTTQKHELMLTRLGGDGMHVTKNKPVHRTYLALRSRGLLELGLEVWENTTHFEITDAGRVVADKLIAANS